VLAAVLEIRLDFEMRRFHAAAILIDVFVENEATCTRAGAPEKSPASWRS
jgi:hypothetical protein